MENKWKKISDISIPPLNTKGFQDMIILRSPVEAKRLNVAEEITSILMHQEDMEPTVILQEESRIYVVKSLKTAEEYTIQTFPVTLGKGSMCDIILQGNKAISRKHAQILQEDEHFYLKDLGSSNHTFIEDTVIENEVELPEGGTFRLADELFVFQQKKEDIQ